MGSSLSLTQKENDYLLDAIQQLKKTELEGMYKYYENTIESWKEVPLKFAITGESKTRSSFLHFFLRLYQDDTKYTHPEHKNVIELCELPGLKVYPSFRSFCKAIGGLEQYDAFLIFCKSPLTNHEIAMAEKLSREFKKPFVFIKVDFDTKNNKNEHCSENPKDFVKDGSDIYVIDQKIMDDESRFKRLCEHIMWKTIKRRRQYFYRCFNREIYKKEEFSQIDRLRAEIKYVVEKRGVDHISKLLTEFIKLWSNAEIRFAVVGKSGAGKSTFINVVRGLKGEDEGQARTGVTETTKVASKYFFPGIKEIVLSDLPGLGSPELPNLQEYCVQFELEMYDAFLILSDSRFSEHDRKLARKISKDFKKPFFFVRTKIDYDVFNNSKIEKNEKETKEEILNDLKTNLKDLVRKDEDIFLIDNRSPQKHDFQRLKEMISEKINDIHGNEDEDKEIIGLLKNEARDVIELKAKYFNGIAWKAGISMHFDYYTSRYTTLKTSIKDKVNEYRGDFGLKELSLSQVMKLINEHVENPNSSDNDNIGVVAKNASKFFKMVIEDAKTIALAKI